MREIKFNAVEEEIGDYIIYNNWLIENHSGAHTDNDDLSLFLEYYFDYKLLQYTGLKDKNGVEIYEFMEIDTEWEVQFSNGCYILINISNKDIITLSKYMEKRDGQITITKEYTKI